MTDNELKASSRSSVSWSLKNQNLKSKMQTMTEEFTECISKAV